MRKSSEHQKILFLILKCEFITKTKIQNNFFFFKNNKKKNAAKKK